MTQNSTDYPSLIRHYTHLILVLISRNERWSKSGWIWHGDTGIETGGRKGIMKNRKQWTARTDPHLYHLWTKTGLSGRTVLYLHLYHSSRWINFAFVEYPFKKNTLSKKNNGKSAKIFHAYQQTAVCHVLIASWSNGKQKRSFFFHFSVTSETALG